MKKQYYCSDHVLISSSKTCNETNITHNKENTTSDIQVLNANYCHTQGIEADL